MISNKSIRFGTIGVVLAVIFIAVMFASFFLSDDWAEVKKIVSEQEVVINTVGNIIEIEPNIFDFSYSFGGARAEFDAVVLVVGSKGTKKYRVNAQREDWKWKLMHITDDINP